LKVEDSLRAHIIEFNNKVIHGIAMALLLNRYACNETGLACSSFAAEKR
jgi:hypothetical protein